MRQIAFRCVAPDEDVLTAVVEAVGEYRGVEPATVSPGLHRAVDADALRDLFAPTADGTRRSGGQVTFPYRSATVVVDFDVHGGETWVRVLDRVEGSPSTERSAPPSNEG